VELLRQQMILDLEKPHRQRTEALMEVGTASSLPVASRQG
jgi:hypothetical protein